MCLSPFAACDVLYLHELQALRAFVSIGSLKLRCSILRTLSAEVTFGGEAEGKVGSRGLHKLDGTEGSILGALSVAVTFGGEVEDNIRGSNLHDPGGTRAAPTL